MKRRQLFLLLQIATLCLIICFACNTKSPEAGDKKESKKASKKAPGDVVAVVNGKEILRQRFEQVVSGFSKNQSMGMKELPPEQQKAFEEKVLQNLIETQLLYQASEQEQIIVTPEELSAKMDTLEKSFPSKEVFQKTLSDNGVSLTDLTSDMRKNIAIQKLISEKVVGNIEISEAEAKKFYEENQDKFVQQEAVEVRHILIKLSQEASAEEEEQARKKLLLLEEQLKQGKDFASLAQENSDCPSAKQGGELGYIGRGQTVPPFEAAAFSLKKGEISEIVKTSFGLHLIKVTDKKIAEPIPFDKVAADIDNFLKQQQQEKKIQDYVNGLREKATIETFL